MNCFRQVRVPPTYQPDLIFAVRRDYELDPSADKMEKVRCLRETRGFSNRRKHRRTTIDEMDAYWTFPYYSIRTRIRCRGVTIVKCIKLIHGFGVVMTDDGKLVRSEQFKKMSTDRFVIFSRNPCGGSDESEDESDESEDGDMPPSYYALKAYERRKERFNNDHAKAEIDDLIAELEFLRDEHKTIVELYLRRKPT